MESIKWYRANGRSHRTALRTGSGPVVVLVNEMGGAVESWDRVMPHIQPECSILRYDQRGSGLSEKVREPFTVHDLADDLHCLLETMGVDRPVVVVGVAMGGATALSFAARYSHCVSAVLAIVPTLGQAESDWPVSDALADSVAAEGMDVIAAFTKSYPDHFRRRDPLAFEQFLLRAKGNDPRSYALHFKAAARVRLDEDLSRISCPAWVAAGTHDIRPTAQFEAICQRIPSAAFRIIEAGHYANAHAPEAVGLLISEVIWNRGGAQA